LLRQNYEPPTPVEKFRVAFADSLDRGTFVLAGSTQLKASRGIPTLPHQDPRYFRRGTGSGWSRLRYALGQALWTHYDSSTLQFNYSDIVGSVAAVAISNAYYADNRTAGDAAAKLGFPIATDTARNILKVFWRESSIVAKDEIHEDEISEVDERRHRTNCRLSRATLRKH
jgi:hypothetical protein